MPGFSTLQQGGSQVQGQPGLPSETQDSLCTYRDPVRKDKKIWPSVLENLKFNLEPGPCCLTAEGRFVQSKQEGHIVAGNYMPNHHRSFKTWMTLLLGDN